MKSLLIILSIVLLAPAYSSAQIFNRIKKDVQNKLEKKIEDRIVEEVSNAIVRAAYKPIDKGFDNLVKSYYGADTTETGEIDWEKINSRSNAMLESFDATDRLPEKYTFDLYLDVEMTDYEKNKNESRMLYTKEKAILGIQQKEDGVTNLIVIDLESDLIAMYKEEDGKKSVYAIPNMNSMGAAYKNAMNKDNPDYHYTFEKTGKSKNIASYHSEEYKGESEDEKLTVYMATSFPVDWRETYGEFLNNFMPENYTGVVEEMKGMVMYSESVLKENSKKKSKWEVKKVHLSDFVVDNSEYEKMAYGK